MVVRRLNCLLGRLRGYDDGDGGGGASDRAVVT
jgi:hypothetical protein